MGSESDEDAEMPQQSRRSRIKCALRPSILQPVSCVVPAARLSLTRRVAGTALSEKGKN